LIHLVTTSRADSSLGGGAPTYIAAAGGVLGAGALLDAVPTAIEGRPSRFLIDGFLLVVSTTVSGQIVFLSSPRSHRKKPHRKWCPVAQRPGAALLQPNEAEEGDAPAAIHV
jgi:hypothetical protein